MTDSLSREQARKLVLHAQRLPPGKPIGFAKSATLSAIENMGYVQIDTTSVIQRAHHHTLWNRNPRYKPAHLDQLLDEKQVFEYWSHAAAYLPMRDLRFSLLRKQALKTGEQNHWFKRDEKLMKYVLDRITAEGPLMAKDFEQGGKKSSGWGSKPAKQALENLFVQGDLMIPRRVNFHKAYDLTERVIPEGINTSMPSQEEYIRFLIFQYLEANGLGQPVDMSYLLKNVKPLVESMLKEMVSAGEVLLVHVGAAVYHVLPASLELLKKPLARSKLKFLSPFDNLLIQRKRMSALFDFDYQIECYLPDKKRKFGYFSLPVLWDGKLVARMDCKADRSTSVMHIHHLALESGLSKIDAFFKAFRAELASFMEFNNCSYIQVHKTSPQEFKKVLSAAIKEM